MFSFLEEYSISGTMSNINNHESTCAILVIVDDAGYHEEILICCLIESMGSLECNLDRMIFHYYIDRTTIRFVRGTVW